MPGETYIPQDVYTAEPKIYATQDFVLGGQLGDSNLPLEQLFNNTEYLYNRLGRFEDIRTTANDYGYDPVDARKLFSFVFSSVNRTFSLPLLAGVELGHMIAVTTEIATVNCLTILAAGSEQIKYGSSSMGRMYMHDGETLLLVAAGSHWKVFQAIGHFDNAGDSFHARAQRKNTFILNGDTLNRANNARLFDFVKTYLTDGNEVVSDNVWLSDPLSYRGLFSWGDGDANSGTTFRLPDERGMFDRGLDLGRGVSLGRISEVAGGYEADDFKSHSHEVDLKSRNGVSDNASGRDVRIPNAPTDKIQTSSVGGTETRPKNIGKIPLIYY